MFQGGRLRILADYMRCPPAWFYPRILVGAGAFLTQRFAAEHNITHVINCAHDDACPEWFSHRYQERYLCIDAIDSFDVNILEWYPLFEATLHRFLRQGTGVVYVHCQAGMNRSGSLALAYVCKNFHLPLEEVVIATKRQRPVLFQNLVFMNQVKEFINGRVSRPENTRLDIDGVHNGNAGLLAPDDRAGLEGLIVNASELEGGAGQPALDGIGVILEERFGFSGEGEPDGDALEDD